VLLTEYLQLFGTSVLKANELTGCLNEEKYMVVVYVCH